MNTSETPRAVERSSNVSLLETNDHEANTGLKNPSKNATKDLHSSKSPIIHEPPRKTIQKFQFAVNIETQEDPLFLAYHPLLQALLVSTHMSKYANAATTNNTRRVL